MTRRRWIADEYSHDRAALTGSHALHLSRTLRARIGQAFEVVCGDVVRRGVVSRVADDRVEFTLAEAISATSIVPITLLLAIFKFDRMEWAIEKCTELNVTTIIPVIARRTEKHLAHTAGKRVERWRRIAREASEQSRRVVPPEIDVPVKLRDALSRFAAAPAKLHDAVKTVPDFETKPSLSGIDSLAPSTVIPTESFSPSGGIGGSLQRAVNIVLAETDRDLMLIDILRAHPNARTLTLAIGPEGGWTPEELRLFADSHWLLASLGETILRAETAAIAAMAIARAQSEALSS